MAYYNSAEQRAIDDMLDILMRLPVHDVIRVLECTLEQAKRAAVSYENALRG
jgi:hypothetical protein